jgi:citrate lyase subunit beta / citryl-CoA lyase
MSAAPSSAELRQAVARWRSLLFVPAHQQRFVSRAHEWGADAVILDLEDAVPVAEKAAARAGLPDAVRQVGQRGSAVLVRVNHGLRVLAPDLEAAIIEGVSALVLPKAESAEWVAEIADAVQELELERGLPEGGIGLVLQIETPGALPRLFGLGASHPRVLAMTIGPEDFCAALGAVPGQDALLSPNLAVLCAARAAGIVPLGFVGSIGAYEDLDAFRAMVAQARELGFRGAMAVHPKQVGILNETFAPTTAEVEWAQRVLDGDRAARADGKGAFRLDGRMIDAPVVRRAREITGRVRKEGLP